MSTAGGLLRSGRAATAAQIVRILALQATHIYVRRHVPPAEMGIWNWLEPLFLLLATVRDLGLPSHVVRLRPWPFGTLARVELVWGALVGTGVWFGAPAIAQLFSEPGPQIVAGIRALLAFFVLEGVAAIFLTWFEANLRIERTFGIEMARTLVYCSVVLAGAVRGAGFWSFVLAQVVSQAVYAAGLWLAARREIDLHHVPGTALPMIRAGVPIAGVWFLAMAVTYADFFVVGKMFDRHLLGLYAFGYGYAYLVTRILQPPLGRSLYPALVAFDADRAEQFRAYRLATVLFLGIEAPAAFFLAANSRLATLLLAGREYVDAAPFLALLAFAPVVDPLGRFGGELLVSRGLYGARLASLGLQLAGLVGGGIALSHALGSPFGMAWANFFPAGSLVVLFVLSRGGDRREIRRLARELAEVYLLPVVPFALALLLTPHHHGWRLAATSAAGLVSLGWLWRRHREEFRAFFARREPAPGPAQ
jgi:O-antigen/teichoic acid export membrane protein